MSDAPWLSVAVFVAVAVVATVANADADAATAAVGTCASNIMALSIDRR